MNTATKKENTGRAPGVVSKAKSSASDRTTPHIVGQCAQVLNLIRQRQPILSLVLTADCAIPETAARVHDLRAVGFNILTTIRPVVMFRGVERRNVAAYSIGTPEWPRPGHFDTAAGIRQLDLDLGNEVACREAARLAGVQA